MGNGPEGAPAIDLIIGAPQSDIFRHYKLALMRATALDRAVRTEERQVRREKRLINPDNIDKLTERYLGRMPYKAHGCRYHSFVSYVSTIKKLGWIEPTGQEEPSAFQDHYPSGQPRKYFRLTAAGKAAPDSAWANPLSALYR